MKGYSYIYIIVICLLSLNDGRSQTYWNTTCGDNDPSLNTIMINACCGAEAYSEYFVFQTGPSGFDISNSVLSLEVMNTPTDGNPVNSWSSSPATIATLNNLLDLPNNCTASTQFIDAMAPPVNGNIPPNKIVWAFLANPPDVSCYTGLSDQLCGSQDIYVIFGNYVPPSNNSAVFQNGSASSCMPGPCYRDIEVIMGACTTNIVYNASVFTTTARPGGSPNIPSGVDGDNISSGPDNTVSYNFSDNQDCAPEGVFCTDPLAPILMEDTLVYCYPDAVFPTTDCNGCSSSSIWYSDENQPFTISGTTFPPNNTYFPNPSGDTTYYVYNVDGVCSSDHDSVVLISVPSPPTQALLTCPGCPPAICFGDSLMFRFLYMHNHPFDIVISYSGMTDTFVVDDFPFDFYLGPFVENTTVTVDYLINGVCNVVPPNPLSWTVMVTPLDTSYVMDASCNLADTGTVMTIETGTDGCDSIVFTTTVFLPSTTMTINQTTCDPGSAGTTTDTFTAANSCDSIVTIITTYDPSLIDTTMVMDTSCNPADTGTTSATTIGADGCDSIVITTTTLDLPSQTMLMDFTCNPSDVGLMYDTLTAANTCDSIVITDVQFDPTAIDTTMLMDSSCNPSDTGTSSVTLMGGDGCDSVVITTTTLDLPSQTMLMDFTCNPSDVGLMYDTLTAANTCDSIVITDVQFDPTAIDTTMLMNSSCNPSDTGTTSVTMMGGDGCDSVVITTTTLDLPTQTMLMDFTCNPSDVGLMYDTLTAANTCDSIVITDVQFDPTAIDTTMLMDSSCNPSDTGTTSVTMMGGDGCDSVVITTTTLDLPTQTMLMDFTCNPSDVGLMYDTLTAANTCDSIVITDVQFDPTAIDTTMLMDSSCNPSDTGTTSVTMMGGDGCDSVVITTTTLDLPTQTMLMDFTCNPSDVGLMYDTLTAANTCDSIVITDVQFDPTAIDTTMLMDSSCNPSDTGTTSVTMMGGDGCDSVVITTTTLDLPTQTMLMDFTCNPSDVGLMYDTLTAANTCDSIVITDVQFDPTAIDTTVLMDSSCNPLDTGTTSVTMMGGDGCDSVVITTTTLDLPTQTMLMDFTCNPSDVGLMYDTLTAANTCDSIVITDVQFDPTAIDTTVLMDSSCNPSDTGTSIVTLMGSDGCDSVIITTTALLPSPTAADLTFPLCGDSPLITFNLADVETDVLNGQTMLTVTFHGNVGDATTGDNPLSGSYMNTSNPEIIFARVENSDGCFTIIEVTLVVNLNPVVSNINTECAADLQTYSITFFSTVDSHTVTGGYTITNIAPMAYEISGIAAGSPVVLTAVDPVSGCSIGYFVDAPICDCDFVSPPVSLGDTAVCEGASIPSLQVSLGDDQQAYWYTTAAGGVAIDSGLVHTPSVSGVGVYTFYVEAVDTISNCISDTRTPITIEVLANPMANNFFLELCASGTTGAFDLTLADDAVRGGQPGLVVTYHETNMDAIDGINPLASPYMNTSNGQILFARVENAAGCFAIAELTLQVNSIPWIMVNDQNCSDDLLTYSIDVLTDADSLSINGDYPITNNGGGFYTIDTIPAGTNVTIYFSVIATGCNDSIVVAAPDCSCDPVTPPVSLGDTSICEGSAIPALEVQAVPGIGMVWYDVPVGGSMLHVGSAYTPDVTGVGSYTYYVEALDSTTNCTSTTRTAITLQITATPTAADASLTLCDDDGIALFDLTEAFSAIGSGQGGVVISYHATMEDAEQDMNPLSTSYSNSMSPEIIFARVEDGNGCFAISLLTLAVNLNPILSVDSVFCSVDLLSYSVTIQTDGDSVGVNGGYMIIDDGGGQYTISGIDGGTSVSITVFNTSTDCSTSQVINPPNCDCGTVQPPVSLGDTSLCLTTGQIDLAVEGVDGIRMEWYDAPAGGTLLDTGTVYSVFLSGSGTFTYYVQAVEISTNCTSPVRTPIELTIHPIPTAANAQLSACGNQTALFNLTDAEAVIINGQPGVQVSFHETLTEAEMGTNPLTSPYQNMTNPEVIFARVTNAEGCWATSFVTLEVTEGGTIDSMLTFTCDPSQVMTTRDTFTGADGCDSIIYQDILLAPSYVDTIVSFTCDTASVGIQVDSMQTIFGCDSVILNDIRYDADAIDSTSTVAFTCFMAQVDTTAQVLVGSDGCDSIVVTYTMLSPTYRDTTNTFVCDPSLVGAATDSLQTVAGCDSLITIISNLAPSFRDTVVSFTCDTASVGIQVDSMQTIFGCDSIIVNQILFDVDAIDSVQVDLLTCNPDSVGIQRDTLEGSDGCDSIVITVIMLAPSSRDTIVQTTCDMTQTGFFADTMTNLAGCDSIIVTEVTFDPAGIDSSMRMEITCDPDQIGIMRDTIVGMDGCDSILITEFVFGTQLDTVQAVTCNPADVGVERDTFLLPDVCDSIVVTITTFDPDGVDTTVVQQTSCNPADIGMSSTSLVGVDGCDSVVITETTLVPLLPDTTLNFSCNPDEVGFYPDTLVTDQGCDSIHVVQIMFDPDAVDTTTIQSFTCNPVDTGVFYEMYMDQFGCDSVVALITSLQGIASTPTRLLFVTCNENLVGTDTLSLVNATGCDSMVIRTYELGDYTIDIDPFLSIISFGDSVLLTITSPTVDFSTVRIQWTPSEGLSCDTCVSTWASPTLSTTYRATVTDEFDCSDTETATVAVESSGIYVPNAFSPNNDQINDYFTAYSDRPVFIELMEIYNRWGGRVFRQQQVDLTEFDGWDGTINGEDAQVGVYVYYIQAIVDGEEQLIQGDLTLVR